MKNALTVFLKEIRESLRDRKTLVNTLLVGPLVAPALLALVIQTQAGHRGESADRIVTVQVEGGARAPELLRALRAERVELVEAAPQAVGGIAEAIRRGKADVGVRVPADFDAAWREASPAPLEVVYDASRPDSVQASVRVKTAVLRYAQKAGALRLAARGVEADVSTPVALSDEDVSTPASRAGTLFAMMPYFFILGAFVGGMAIAIDVTAGERERRSLESLFLNPVPRGALLLGKIGATAAFSLVSVVLGVAAFAALGRVLPIARLGVDLHLSAGFSALAVLLMLPMSALIASVQVAIAAFARSYREAQTYLSLLMFVPVVPSVMLSVGGAHRDMSSFALPLVGQHLLITRLLRGDPVEPASVAACVLGTAAVALLAYVAVNAVYRSDRLPVNP